MTAPTTSPAARLLAGYLTLGRASDLGDHLSRYGPPPTLGTGRLIAAVEDAGLTGRGGAGFPTGRKLRSVAASRRPAVVVVNGAEGEPASGKDRLLLTVAPHLVLDGAALAAEAVGAREIVICVHSGGQLAVHVEWAVAEREEARLTAVPTRVCRVPGRYVAGEETALVSWINGGEPRPAFTPPRPYERGVGGRPTLVSNAETYAHIALIARHGPEWFRSCGSADAPGTALFTVTGAVRRPGVLEAPLGTSIAELIRMADGPAEQLQAVLVGGYGGTWLPPALLRTPTSPAALTAVGAALGPGIVIALPSRACGLAESARILAWLAAETAGQCGPCVFGLPAIAEDLTEIARCQGNPPVYQRLQGRLQILPGRGACRHPDGAVRFATSALRVFGSHLGHHQRGLSCLAAQRPGMLPLPARR